MNITSTRMHPRPNASTLMDSKTSKDKPSTDSIRSRLIDGTGNDFVDMSLLGATPLVGAITNFGVGAVVASDGKYLAGFGSLGGIAANLGGTGAVTLGLLRGDGAMMATGAGLLAASGATAGLASLTANDWFRDTGVPAAGMAALGMLPGVGAVTNFGMGVTSALNEKYVPGMGNIAGIGANLLGTGGLVVSLTTGDQGGLQASLALLAASGVTAGIGAIASDM